jgi:hypothetical protein
VPPSHFNPTCLRACLPASTHPALPAGVIGGIAALKALKDAGFVPARPLEVVMFTSEEPTRFALSCSGSRAMAGAGALQCLFIGGGFLDRWGAEVDAGRGFAAGPAGGNPQHDCC